MRLNARRFKQKKKEPKYVVRQGVKYTVMNIGGTEFEIRMANKKDVEDFKANKRSLYEK
tara:strand:- start:466 stop:642 length:177 start_codon:yes stop_codon:yes gene_type:complete